MLAKQPMREFVVRGHLQALGLFLLLVSPRAVADCTQLSHLLERGRFDTVLAQTRDCPQLTKAERAALVARARFGQAEYRQAEHNARRWAEVVNTDADRAEALWWAGRSAARLGEHARAAEYFRTALPLAPEAGREVTIRRLVDLADAEIELAEFELAQKRLDRVMALWRVDRHAQSGARLFRALATMHYYRESYGLAHQSYQRAIELAEQADDRAMQAGLLTNLGQVRLAQHEYAQALHFFDRAIAVDPDVDPRTNAIRIASAGIAQFELNRLGAAQSSFERVRELARETGSTDLESWAIGELGLVALERGDSDRAMAMFDRAIELVRQTGQLRNEATWWLNKGKVRRDQGRWSQALEYYRRAQSLFVEAGVEPPNLYKHMARSRAGLGDEKAALELYSKAEALAVQQRNSKVVWETRRELAQLHRLAGRDGLAERAYRAALDEIESMRRQLLLPPMKSSFFEDKVAVYEEFVGFLVDQDRPADAFDIAERSRARALVESMAEARLYDVDPETEEFAREEAQLLAELSRLQVEARERRTGDADARIAAAERELNRLQLAYRARRPEWYALNRIAPAQLPELQSALRAGELAVVFMVAAPRSHLWLVSPGALHYWSLPPRSEIDAMVRAAYTGLQQPGEDEAIWEEFSALLPDDALAQVNAAERLLVVPSGSLYYLPLEAVAQPRGSGYLGELMAMSYWPSISTLARMRGGGGTGMKPAMLLALADPLSGRVDQPARGAMLAQIDTFGALPHTRREVRGLAQLFGARRSTVLIGAAATEATFKEQRLDAFTVVHLATHGWIDDRSPVRSGLVMRHEADLSEDGVLQLREILKLELAAELVTLSACRSALGDLITGEGMVGLARAFMQAGADSIVASLWDVNDEASAELMLRFYRGLAAGLDKAEALRAAKHALMREPRYRHPYYWAGFVLLGDGESTVSMPDPEPAAPKLIHLVALAALVAALLAGLAALARFARRGARR